MLKTTVLKEAVRLATVDNFQGEESTIVIFVLGQKQQVRHQCSAQV